MARARRPAAGSEGRLMNQLHCLQARTTRGCQQRQHALTPNVDRFEIHPPVSTGPQWGQLSGTVSHGPRRRRPSPPPSELGFFRQGRHTSSVRGQGCAGTGTRRRGRALRHRGLPEPGQGRSQPQAAGWCLITVNRHDFTCENCKDSAASQPCFAVFTIFTSETSKATASKLHK
jgi:hypothetical protein